MLTTIFISGNDGRSVGRLGRQIQTRVLKQDKCQLLLGAVLQPASVWQVYILHELFIHGGFRSVRQTTYVMRYYGFPS